MPKGSSTGDAAKAEKEAEPNEDRLSERFTVNLVRHQQG